MHMNPPVSHQVTDAPVSLFTGFFVRDQAISGFFNRDQDGIPVSMDRVLFQRAGRMCQGRVPEPDTIQVSPAYDMPVPQVKL